MTPARYLLCRAALTLGYSRKNTRMGDAASEMHLLKEAEAYLGQAVWTKVENIEGLSVEYWNLRKLVKEHERVAARLDECQNTLATAHKERASLLGSSTEPYQELVEERKKALVRHEELARERDSIVAKAREIRRSYDGIKTKLEVLEKENKNSPEEAKITAEKMAELKKDFVALKEERNRVSVKIAEGEAGLDAIDAEILSRKKERRGEAAGSFQQIGEANQEMSTLRAEIGVLDTQMRQLYSEVGRYVSKASENDPHSRKAIEKYEGMVSVMGALRRSIRMNHRLAEMS